jgi:hypothetical protein
MKSDRTVLNVAGLATLLLPNLVLMLGCGLLISGCGGSGSGGGTGQNQNNPVPTITSLSASSATAGAAAQTLTITGTNFLSSSTVTYNSVAHAATFVSATQLTIQLTTDDLATAGSYSVVITNPAPGGGSSNAMDFTVSAASANPVPTIASLSPSSATADSAAQTLTIAGTNFLSASTVTYNSVAHTATFVSTTQLTIQLTTDDLATAGSYSVVITNPAPGGGASNEVDFTVSAATTNPVPTIASLSPSSATAGAAAQSLAITGTNFLSASTVTYNSVAHAATFDSATQLTIQLTTDDLATAGSYSVVITNPAPGGGASNAMDFTVSAASANPVPTIASLSPSSATAGSAAQSLAITGTNFLSASTVTYNSVAHAATFVSTTQLTIQLTTDDLAAAGSYSVVITNPTPGGGASNAVNFTVNTASSGMIQINSLSATSITPLTPLTITGTGFDPNGTISVLLVSPAGNPPITVPAFAVTSTTVQFMTPPLPVTGGYFPPASFNGDTVEMQVIQVSGSTLDTSNVFNGLSVLALPSLPAGAKTGDLTLYYLESGLNVSATLGADSTSNSWIALGSDLGSYNGDVNALIASVIYVRDNPGQSAAMATSNGVIVSLDSNSLAMSDQLIQAYVTEIYSQIPSTFTPTYSVNDSEPASQFQPEDGQSSPCPAPSGDDATDEVEKEACMGQQYMQTYAAKADPLLKLFGTLYYGFAAEVLGGYASASAAIYGLTPDAIEALQIGWSATGSYVSAAATSSPAPSPCDVVANAGAKILDDVADTGLGIFSSMVNFLQLQRDVSEIQNPSGAPDPCIGPLLTSPATNEPDNTTPITLYQTSNGVTTETTLAAPDSQQSEPVSTATFTPVAVQTYTLTTSVASGNGTGSIESYPDGILCGNCASDSASFPAGTSVTLTATPAAGDTLVGWSGACSGIGSCIVVMNSDQSVMATFSPGQTYSGSFNASFDGTFPDPDGDSYAASASGEIILNLTENSNGTISGTGSVPTNIGITVASCPIGDCETNPSSVTAAGPLSGNASGFVNTFTSSNSNFTLVFTGTLNSDGTVTGSATFSSGFYGTADGDSISTTLSGSIPSITLTQ